MSGDRIRVRAEAGLVSDPVLVCHLFGHDPRPPTMTCRDCGTNLTGET